MIYKWLGVCIILLMGGYASVSLNRMERRRLWVIDGYISLLRYIKGQINCYAMPLHEILAGADPELLMACAGDTREGTVSCSLPVMVQSARLYLQPETERLLKNFISELGQTFREEQVMRCEDYIGALSAERQKLADTAPARVRMNSILSMCTAVGLAILLW